MSSTEIQELYVFENVHTNFFKKGFISGKVKLRTLMPKEKKLQLSFQKCKYKMFCVVLKKTLFKKKCRKM